ncbi:DUF6233 domain-containing protein [Streptomyces sp. IBSBF 2806]|uniref:DUF6233 domain-containing protein n=1 Tax=Streptomyces sp. IBSBF 2806 TaxID=2903529 RepID=UPI002FDBCCE5
MFDDLPPDLERLHTLRVWHTMWLDRIDAKIEAVQQRQAEVEQGRARRPPLPEWTVELGIGAGRPPVQVHAGDCHAAGKRRRAVDRDEAAASWPTACTHCRPDTRLNVIGLCRGATPTPYRCPSPQGHRPDEHSPAPGQRP